MNIKLSSHIIRKVAATVCCALLATSCAVNAQDNVPEDFQDAPKMRKRPKGQQLPVGAARITPVTRNSSKSNATVQLAADGKAALPIVISAQATDGTKTIAAELAEYLKRITGATFEIQPGDGSKGIVMGTLAEFPRPELAEPLKIYDVYDGREAYAIRTEPNRVLLIGATDKGVSHVAFRFLEELGTRWFFPAKEWEVMPTTKKLEFNSNITDRPTVLSRKIWWTHGIFTDPKQARATSRAWIDYINWMKHNRMAQSLEINAGHAWEFIVKQNIEEFKKHPEYYSLVNGKRTNRGKLCVSNENVQRIVQEYAVDYFKKHPQADMVSVDPSDGGDHCECPDCLKMGTISDRVFGLANMAAKAVAKEHPGKLVGLYAYNYHSDPPSFTLEPNVYVQLTVGFNMGKYNFDQLLEMWPKLSKNMGFYEYYSIWLWDFDRISSARASNISYLQESIAKYAEKNATSIDGESSPNWGTNGRGYYIANKLMWNPEADVDALLTDFYEKAFGPSAKVMHRYFERLDQGNKPLMSRQLFGVALHDIQEATELAKDRPDVLARLTHLKQYWHYMELRWQIDRLSDKVPAEKAEKKKLTLAALTHVYRSRYSYMNHWGAMSSRWSGESARLYEEPSWGTAWMNGPTPWNGMPEYTAEETEKLFRQTMAFFKPQDVTEVKFSNDLVPVKFEGSPELDSYIRAPSTRYALYSFNGEPIKIELMAGAQPKFRGRASAPYVLLTPDEDVVVKETPPLDGEFRTMEWKVPKAGLYYLDLEPTKAHWIVRLPPNTPGSVVLEQGQSVGHTKDKLFFYVPKGTKRIDYYWSGFNHSVLGPDGKEIAKSEANGEVVTVPVPEGMDGKTWSFRGVAWSRPWFFNLPNVVAASPNALLLPRELVEKDGLQLAGK